MIRKTGNRHPNVGQIIWRILRSFLFLVRHCECVSLWMVGHANYFHIHIAIILKKRRKQSNSNRSEDSRRQLLWGTLLITLIHIQFSFVFVVNVLIRHTYKITKWTAFFRELYSKLILTETRQRRKKRRLVHQEREKFFVVTIKRKVTANHF